MSTHYTQAFWINSNNNKMKVFHLLFLFAIQVASQVELAKSDDVLNKDDPASFSKLEGTEREL